MERKSRREYEPVHVRALIDYCGGSSRDAAEHMHYHYSTIRKIDQNSAATKVQEQVAFDALQRLKARDAALKRVDEKKDIKPIEPAPLLTADSSAADMARIFLGSSPKTEESAPPPTIPVLKHDQPGVMRMLPPGRRSIFTQPAKTDPKPEVTPELPKPGPTTPPEPNPMVQLLVSIPASKLQSFHRVTALMGAEVAEL